MDDAIRVELTRIVDRDALCQALEEQGMVTWVVAGNGGCALDIESGGSVEDVLSAIDTWIWESDAPLVPMRSNGEIVVRTCSE